jgi:hypothetical protein
MDSRRLDLMNVMRMSLRATPGNTWKRAFALVAVLALGAVVTGAQSDVSASQEPTAEPAPGSGEAKTKIDFAGYWFSQFGDMELQVDGTEVAGTYSCCQGTITGTIKGAQIEFKWKDPIYGEGWGYFHWQPPGDRLRGTFAYEGDFGSAGGWNALRVPELEPRGEVKRYRVITRHERHGEFQGVATFDIAEGNVRGRIRGHYDLEARSKPFRFEILNLVSGEASEDGGLDLHWADPLYKTEGHLRLSPKDGGLQGKWTSHFAKEGDPEGEIRLEPLSNPGEEASSKP